MNGAIPSTWSSARHRKTTSSRRPTRASTRSSQARFGRVRSVNVLRETRALRGFTRVRDDVLKLNVGKALLRRESLPPEEDWLPAYVVKGEGIYLELNAGQLTAWESRAEVRERADMLASHYGAVASQRGLQPPVLTPRFVMIHTLGHLLINELIFTCGYSSASLRERLVRVRGGRPGDGRAADLHRSR